MKFTSEQRDATCQWDHTVLSATRQRWPPRLHPIRTGWYSIYRPRKDERLSWPSTLPVPGGVLPVLLIGKDSLRSSYEASVVTLSSAEPPVVRWLCRTTDDRRFNQILSNKVHVLNNLLPPISVASQNYNLRQRRHHLKLHNKTNHNNFIQRMLFLDSY